MKEPLVSVVLTNHDGERFVEEAVRSVLNQSFTDFELIIVDDASTDRSPDILRSMDDPRIRILECGRNGHVSMAHNAGNALARGKYIAAMDNDDLWKTEKLQKQVDYMEAHPETAVCFTGLDFVDEKGRPYEDDTLRKLYTIHNGTRAEWLHTLLTTGNHVANDSSLIRRAVMEEIGENDLCMLQLHDYDMYVKIALKHDLYILEEPLMSYRRFQGSGSITAHGKANARRSVFEFSWIIGHTVTDMDPELFREVFAGEMLDPGSSTPEEILCEKAALLSSGLLHEDCRWSAVALYERIFADPGTTKLLWEKYDLDQHEVYRITGSAAKEVLDLEERIRRQEEEYSLLLDRFQHVDIDYKQISGSAFWRMTGPLRSLVYARRERKAAKLTQEQRDEQEKRSLGLEIPDPEEWNRQRAAAEVLTVRFGIRLPEAGDPALREKTLRALRGQSWPHWELTGPDGAGSGDYVLALEPGDLLSPSALYRLAKAAAPDVDLIYADETVPGAGEAERMYKPDFSPDLLRSMNYIGRFATIRRERLAGSPETYGAVLRACEGPGRAAHVPRPLFCGEPGTPDAEADRQALAEHLERTGLRGTAEDGRLPGTYRIQYEIEGDPKVSIVIPNKDHREDLEKCITSILEKTTWPNWEILIVDNNSSTEEIRAYYAQLRKKPAVRVITREGKFNFAAVCNAGVKETDGDYVLLLNNDTRVISPDWLEQMLMLARRKDVGAVGALLYYPDDTVQHGGVILGAGGTSNHFHVNRKRGEAGEMNRLAAVQDLSAVTGACLMTRREVWEQLGGLDEKFALVYNDLDFCLRAGKLGLRTVWTPWAELYHDESRSRGLDTNDRKVAFFLREDSRFRVRWREELAAGDPYYHGTVPEEC